jgi:hypothetical protein
LSKIGTDHHLPDVHPDLLQEIRADSTKNEAKVHQDCQFDTIHLRMAHPHAQIGIVVGGFRLIHRDMAGIITIFLDTMKIVDIDHDPVEPTCKEKAVMAITDEDHLILAVMAVVTLITDDAAVTIDMKNRVIGLGAEQKGTKVHGITITEIPHVVKAIFEPKGRYVDGH